MLLSSPSSSLVNAAVPILLLVVVAATLAAGTTSGSSSASRRSSSAASSSSGSDNHHLPVLWWQPYAYDSITASPTLAAVAVSAAAHPGSIDVAAVVGGKSDKPPPPPLQHPSVLFLPQNDTLRAILAINGTVLWSRRLRSNGSIAFPFRSPTADGDRVVAGCGSMVAAFHAASGKTLWQRDVGAAIMYGQPVVLHLAPSSTTPRGPTSLRSLVAVATTANVVALGYFTGAVAWRFPVSYPLGVAGWRHRALYVASSLDTIFPAPQFLYGIDAVTGDQIWNQTFGNQSATAVPSVDDDEGIVFLPWSDNATPLPDTNMCAFNASTGDELWCKSSYNDFNRAVASEGAVYYSDYGGFLWARNATTGADLWFSGFEFHASGEPAIAGNGEGVVYLTGGLSPSVSALRAFDASSGGILWTWQIPDSYTALNRMPWHQDALYVSTESDVYALYVSVPSNVYVATANCTDAACYHCGLPTVYDGVACLQTGPATSTRLRCINSGATLVRRDYNDTGSCDGPAYGPSQVFLRYTCYEHAMVPPRWPGQHRHNPGALLQLPREGTHAPQPLGYTFSLCG